MFGDSDFYLSEKLKLESFCAYQDRCIFDIKKKLKSSLLSEEKKEQLITELIQDKFIAMSCKKNNFMVSLRY